MTKIGSQKSSALCTSVDVVLLYVLFGLHVHLAVHPLHVTRDVHLLLGAVHTVRALELRLFAALPLLVVTERGLEFVHSAAVGAAEAGLTGRGRQRGRVHPHAGDERQRQPRRPLVPGQAADPSERDVFRHAASAA